MKKLFLFVVLSIGIALNAQNIKFVDPESITYEPSMLKYQGALDTQCEKSPYDEDAIKVLARSLNKNSAEWPILVIYDKDTKNQAIYVDYYDRTTGAILKSIVYSTDLEMCEYAKKIFLLEY